MDHQQEEEVQLEAIVGDLNQKLENLSAPPQETLAGVPVAAVEALPSSELEDEEAMPADRHVPGLAADTQKALSLKAATAVLAMNRMRYHCSPRAGGGLLDVTKRAVNLAMCARRTIDTWYWIVKSRNYKAILGGVKIARRVFQKYQDGSLSRAWEV